MYLICFKIKFYITRMHNCLGTLEMWDGFKTHKTFPINIIWKTPTQSLFTHDGSYWKHFSFSAQNNFFLFCNFLHDSNVVSSSREKQISRRYWRAIRMMCTIRGSLYFWSTYKSQQQKMTSFSQHLIACLVSQTGSCGQVSPDIQLEGTQNPLESHTDMFSSLLRLLQRNQL